MDKENYSVAICPPKEFTDEIKKMKLELAAHIGWFSSKNAEAHITINTFNADDIGLTQWKNYVTAFCSSISKFEITLVETGTYSNGAFYLAPDHASKEKLVDLMKSFHENAPLEATVKSSDPHLSIARRLRKDQLSIAQELYGNKAFNFKFTCDNLAFRKLDMNIRQYFIESRFAFHGN